MVSTTLTTIAAGQPTSSSNHHQQSLALPANNSEFLRSPQQQLHHASSPTPTLTRSSFYYDPSNRNRSEAKTTNTFPATEGTANSNHHPYKRLSSVFSGRDLSHNQTNTSACGTGSTPTTALEEASKPDLLSPLPQSATNAKVSRTDSTAPAANLSRSLHSPSPPLADQISILFPKCRPKHASNSNNSSVNNSTSNSQHGQGVALSGSSESVANQSSKKEDSTTAKPTSKTLGSSPPSDSSSKYYKNVNIITQSPPPPSTSSVSSESLSSVTPRISTNPFLCSSLPSDSNGDSTPPIKPHEDRDKDEELPVPAYQPFYYHSSGTDVEPDAELSRGDPNQHDMPRKRSSFPSYHHLTQQYPQVTASAMGSIDGQHQLQKHQPVYNTAIATLQNHSANHSSQNPFIKDNYWERRQNMAPNMVLNSPEYSGIKAELPPHQSLRRTYHQQTFDSNQYLPRQQHHLRVGRSPISHGDQSQQAKLNHSSSQQQQQQHDPHLPVSSHAGHHMFSGKGSTEPLPTDWDHRERRDRESRDRERDRDQREHRAGDTESRECDAQRDLERARDDRDNDPQSGQQSTALKAFAEGSLSKLSDSEMVVFDDITESWQKLRVTTEPSAASSRIMSTSAAPNFHLRKQHQLPCKSLVKDENPEDNNGDPVPSKTHKIHQDRNFAMTVKSNHGIIEYEGSPRRIGHGASTPEEETVQPVIKTSQASASGSSNSPQLHQIRPGFPQRIVSSARENTPPMILLNHSNLKQQHQQQQIPSPVDNNAEDTSNDVSEIGTLSDMTTSDMTSTAGPPADDSAEVTPTVPAIMAGNHVALGLPPKSSTFDYLYEFSETRKVLEEFFKCPSNDENPMENGSDVDSIDIQYEFHSNLDREDDEEDEEDDEDIEPLQKRQFQQLQQHQQNQTNYNTNQRRHFTSSPLMRDFDFFLDSASRSSGEPIDHQDGINHNQVDGKNNYRYSPETTDYDSNCGDLDSLSGELNGISTSCSNYAKYYASSMPVLEDGLSSGHTSDTENNNQNNINNNLQQISSIQTQAGGGISILMDMRTPTSNSMNNAPPTVTSEDNSMEKGNSRSPSRLHDAYLSKNESPLNGVIEDSGRESERLNRESHESRDRELLGQSPSSNSNKVFKNIDPDLDSLYSISVFQRPDMTQMTPPPPAPAPHRKPNSTNTDSEILQPVPYKDIRPATNVPFSATTTTSSVASTISSTLSRTKPTLSNISVPKMNTTVQPPPIPERNNHQSSSPVINSPVWVPRHLDSACKSLLESSSENQSKNMSADEEDVDTDLETDRLLGHQRLDDQGYYDENKSWDRKPRSLLAKISPKQQTASTKTRNGYNALLSSTPEIPPPVPPKNSSKKLLDIGGSMSSPEHSEKTPEKSINIQECVVTVGSPAGSDVSGCGSHKKDISGSGTGDNAAQNGGVNSNSAGSVNVSGEKKVKKSKNKEGGAVLIEGVLFRARYLGSTQLVCEGQPTKSTRMMQAEEAVSRIKALAPDGDVQPSTEVDLFISTEKIMVLNTDLKEIMMDHALRTISYIADIGDLVVLMARRRFVPQDIDDGPKPNRTPKMICHVFESDEAQFIAQSIGQAFQVAYMEFLKANGIEDHSFVKEMDYQEVLNSQEIFGDELEIFAKKELQKEVVVPKAKGEILGVVIVESGWGSMLPTVVIANLMSTGAAARCGQLNIGDQLIAINGLSLVGLPLSTCQTYIKNTKNQTVVKFTVVPCAPVVEVKIKRPNTKYQLGFSVQNGVICSLLRGGIAERGGVRVGHRIIEINNQSVVAVPHEKIVNLLATSVGEILMKTMPTSMFRLLTGQENPIYI